MSLSVFNFLRLGFERTLFNPPPYKQHKPLSNNQVLELTPLKTLKIRTLDKSYHSQKAQRSRLIEVLKRLIKNF